MTEIKNKPKEMISEGQEARKLGSTSIEHRITLKTRSKSKNFE